MGNVVGRVFWTAFLSIPLLSIAGAQYRAVVLPLPQDYPWAVGNGAAGNVFGGYSVPLGGTALRDERALLWTEGRARDVTPQNYFGAQIVGSGDGQHVGSVSPNPNTYVPYAYLWNSQGTGALLHPQGYTTSEANGVGGGKQVGNVVLAFFCSECGYFVERHAALWSGTAGSMQQLHAPGFNEGRAEDTDGLTHVGSGYLAQLGEYHALLWRGPLDAVDLHSPVYLRTFATAVDANSQVGWGETADSSAHALLWRGSAESLIDLHPSGFSLTVGTGVSGNTQVGAGRTIVYGPDRALAWKGTAQSVVDLHQFLPQGFRLNHSIAEDIDQYGNIVGSCSEDATNLPRAVIWIPTARSRG